MSTIDDTDKASAEQAFTAAKRVLCQYGYDLTGGYWDERSATEWRLVRLASAVAFTWDRRERSRAGEQVTIFPGIDAVAPAEDSYWRNRVDQAVEALRANLAEATRAAAVAVAEASAEQRVEQLERALRGIVEQVEQATLVGAQVALDSIRRIAGDAL